MINYSSLNADFITDRFPELKQQVEKETQDYDEFLPHIFFSNVFSSLTAELLKKDDYLHNDTLRRIFDMFEEMSTQGDEDTQDLVQVTLLEPLWDKKTTYSRASELLGEHTKELWDCISGYLRIP